MQDVLKGNRLPFYFNKCILEEHSFGKYVLGLVIIWLILYFFKSCLVNSCLIFVIFNAILLFIHLDQFNDAVLSGAS